MKMERVIAKDTWKSFKRRALDPILCLVVKTFFKKFMDIFKSLM